MSDGGNGSGDPRDAGPGQDKETDRRRLKILIVDDDEFVRKTLDRALRPHHVLQAGDYHQAEHVMLAPDTELDAVVSDYRMPGPDGVEVLAAASRLQPRAVRMLLTGSPPENIQKLIDSGLVHCCVLKPFQASLPRRLEALARSWRAAGIPET